MLDHRANPRDLLIREAQLSRRLLGFAQRQVAEQRDETQHLSLTRALPDRPRKMIEHAQRQCWDMLDRREQRVKRPALAPELESTRRPLDLLHRLLELLLHSLGGEPPEVRRAVHDGAP